MNTDKTELTHIRRGQKKEEESWRNTKKLGKLQGPSEELSRRKCYDLRKNQLAAASFRNLSQIWTGKLNKTSTEKKMLLYNTYITPILTYNACTWALTDTELKELESFSPWRIRQVLGVRYPRRISNEKLYSAWNTAELGPEIRGARWLMLGHTLRMNEDIPAKRAMFHYFDPMAAKSSSSADHGRRFH